jgi:hypothetical protein
MLPAGEVSAMSEGQQQVQRRRLRIWIGAPALVALTLCAVAMIMQDSKQWQGVELLGDGIDEVGALRTCACMSARSCVRCALVCIVHTMHMKMACAPYYMLGCKNWKRIHQTAINCLLILFLLHFLCSILGICMGKGQGLDRSGCFRSRERYSCPPAFGSTVNSLHAKATGNKYRMILITGKQAARHFHEHVHSRTRAEWILCAKQPWFQRRCRQVRILAWI